jgi:hypothetical protein
MTRPEDAGTGHKNNVADADRLYTRDEVMWYLALGLRWGWEACVDQQNADWPPEPVLTFGKWYFQALEREKADAAVRAEFEVAG